MSVRVFLVVFLSLYETPLFFVLTAPFFFCMAVSVVTDSMVCIMGDVMCLCP